MEEKISDEEHMPAVVMVVLFIIVFGAVFEAVLLGIAFFGADNVKCNWLWCEFSTERSVGHTVMSRDCFMNGARVNCTDTDFEKVMSSLD